MFVGLLFVGMLQSKMESYFITRFSTNTLYSTMYSSQFNWMAWLLEQVYNKLMYNHYNPFTQKTTNQPTTYNHIKRNRAFRSEKKFTQIQHTTHSKQSLKTELIALLDATPHSQDLIKNCLDNLKQKLLDMRISQKKKQELPLQHESIFRRKQPELDEHRKRAKTKPENQHVWAGSQSLNLMSNRKSQEFRQLLNLEEMRRKIKQSKQTATDKRLPTQKQHFRYEQFQDMRRLMNQKQSSKRGERNYSDVKFRSMTEEVIRSHKNPARIYQSLKKVSSSPKKMEIIQTPNAQAVSPNVLQMTPDNNQISKDLFAQKRSSPITKTIDNNEKIGDISTIQAQKETLNFLGQSCLGIKQELSPKKSGKVSANATKMLQFVDWKTNQLKNVFSNMAHHKKRKQGLDKLSKIFPKDFFN